MPNIAHEILCSIESLSQPTATGLMAMLCIAIQEQSNLSAQIKQWGFTDIPSDLAKAINDLQDEEYLEICNFIGAAVLDNLNKVTA